MKTAYTYTILRYVHDVAAGGSLNVGVVVYAPALRYVGARLQTRYSRLRQAFPMLDGEAHGRLSSFGCGHDPRCFTIWIAGSGVNRGYVYGAGDDSGYNIRPQSGARRTTPRHFAPLYSAHLGPRRT